MTSSMEELVGLKSEIEIRIPEELMRAMDAKAEVVAKEVKERGEPQLVVLALRSAAVVYPAFSVFLERKLGKPLSVVEVGVPIGREIPMGYFRELAKRDPDFDLAAAELVEHEDEYRTWLWESDDPILRRIKSEIVNAARGVGGKVERVLILDDAVGSDPPNTITLTAPEIVRSALGPGIEVEANVMLNGDWRMEILEKTVGSMSKAEEFFWVQLMAGSLEMDVLVNAASKIQDRSRGTEFLDLIKSEATTGELLLPIATRKHLMILGLLTMVNKGTDPLVDLLGRYGEKNLVDFSEKVKNKMKSDAKNFRM